MSLWRKRPTQVEAYRWYGPEAEREHAPEWLVEAMKRGEVYVQFPDDEARRCMDIVTDRGVVTAKPGDWIIRGIEGELYPCTHSVFVATYDPVITIDPR